LEEIDQDEQEEINDIDASLKIKYTMLKWIAIGSVGFSLTKAFHYGVINMIPDEFTRVRAYCML